MKVEERLIRDEESVDEIETEIIVLVDRSGSMHSIVDDAVGGFNRFLADQKEIPGKAFLTLVRFDSEYEVVCESTPIMKMKDITAETIKPRWSTALWDAIGQTLVDAIPRFTKKSKVPKVIVVILTDGHENASQRFGADSVKDLIVKCKKYGWKFLFLGANIDAFTTGASMGLSANQSVQYEASSRGITTAYNTVSETVSLFRDEKSV
jgi:Mg-chelatase subunit ChlD